MNVVVFGATDMVGQGVLRECLLDPGVEAVLSVGRSLAGQSHPKLWARVRGQTENALLRLPFKTVAVVRPAGIIPLHGITSRTPLYRAADTLTRPLWPLLYKRFPQYATTTERLGRRLLRIAQRGTPRPILEARDINTLTADES